MSLRSFVRCTIFNRSIGFDKLTVNFRPLCRSVAYAENFHEGGFGSGSYGGYLVCTVCDVTI